MGVIVNGEFFFDMFRPLASPTLNHGFGACLDVFTKHFGEPVVARIFPAGPTLPNWALFSNSKSGVLWLTGLESAQQIIATMLSWTNFPGSLEQYPYTPFLTRQLRAQAMPQVVEQFGQLQNCYIFGHSLGGMAADIVAEILIREHSISPSMVATAGAPSGNRAGIKTSMPDGRYYRFVNHGDVVPYLPSLVAVTNWAGPAFTDDERALAAQYIPTVTPWLSNRLYGFSQSPLIFPDPIPRREDATKWMIQHEPHVENHSCQKYMANFSLMDFVSEYPGDYFVHGSGGDVDFVPFQQVDTIGFDRIQLIGSMLNTDKPGIPIRSGQIDLALRRLVSILGLQGGGVFVLNNAKLQKIVQWQVIQNGPRWDVQWMGLTIAQFPMRGTAFALAKRGNRLVAFLGRSTGVSEDGLKDASAAFLDVCFSPDNGVIPPLPVLS